MIFGKYKKFVEFLRDTAVTEDDLLKMVCGPYERGLCRYVTRHPACTVKVLDEMAKSSVWYVRMVGMFHHTRPLAQVHRYASLAIDDKNGVIRNMAAKQLDVIDAEGLERE